ncbi:MAG: tetratricopeptide repeat protein [Candidatus Omnitrophota bacterium]
MLAKKETYLLLVGLCILVYANSFNNQFVSDDLPAVINNPYISNPLKWLLRPHDLFHSLCYLAGKFNPFLYHLVNIIFHALNSILVYQLLKLFFKNPASILGACLFAVHPIHTEAVTWISGRLYTITGSVILICFHLYYKATQNLQVHKKLNLKYFLACLLVYSYYIIHHFPFFFAFPLFLILFDFTFSRLRKSWKWTLPFLGILVLRLIFAQGIITGRVLGVAKGMGGPLNLTNPIFNFAYSLFSHLGLLLWPAKLTIYHEPPIISLFALRVELILLIILAFSLPYIFRKSKEIFFAIGIFILFLIPTYSPVMVSWLVAERYVYFSSVALSIVLAFSYERFIEDKKKYNRLGLALILFIIAAYAIRTVARNEDWKDRATLWRSTARVSCNSPRAHNNMGDIYGQEGNIAGAISAFKRAIELKPDYADAYHNLANTYHKIGRFDESIKFYKKSLEYNPELFESYLNLGVIYLNQKEFKLATEYFKKALEIKPEDINAKIGLNLALQNKQK